MVYHWEERNKKFPLPSVFELTGRQRLTVKRGIRNVGQFLAAEVTNPGQNESQQMFAFCERMDKEVDILDRDSSPNESPDGVKEGERGRMIGRNPKNGSSTFFVSGNRKKEFSFRTAVGVTCWLCGQSSGWRSEIGLLDKKMTNAFKPNYIKSR